MPAPPARFQGSSVHGTAKAAMMMAMILGTSCNLFLGYGPSASGSPSQSAAPSNGEASSDSGPPLQGDVPSVGPCQAASDWLVTAVKDGLAAPGAYLSEVYVGEAWAFTSGPAAVLSAEFVPAWWIVAKINGAGVRPEVAVWVTNRVGPARSGTIFGANPSAIRYSHFGQGGSNPIRGSGQDGLVACLTPIPES